MGKLLLVLFLIGVAYVLTKVAYLITIPLGG